VPLGTNRNLTYNEKGMAKISGTSGFSRKIPAEAGPPAFSPHEFSHTLMKMHSDSEQQ